MRMSLVLLWIVHALLSAGPGWSAEQTVRIGISQIVEHPALDATRKGFTDYLGENGYAPGKHTEFDYKNAQNNRAVSGQIARKFVGDKADLILAISTPSAQDVAAATKEIPILFSAVTDPVVAGLIKSGAEPGGNVSGTSDKSPIALQLDLIREILPSIKTLGTIYNAGEANSVASVQEMKTEATKRGITVVEATATSSAMVKMATESLVGRVDAIHVPTDNTVVLALEAVVKACQENKIPLFAADVDSVKRGAIAALAVDYYKLGRQTGALAVKILRNKISPALLPVEHQRELLLYLNPVQAEKMGIRIPETVVGKASTIIK
ncbi:MAG TPA: ABC transporter substrate-binding protein [Desulfomonilaceae bacterium]|nr:ABC transporter substrate-binding protein [Desulfomonilaceae bacterium]